MYVVSLCTRIRKPNVGVRNDDTSAASACSSNSSWTPHKLTANYSARSLNCSRTMLTCVHLSSDAPIVGQRRGNWYQRLLTVVNWTGRVSACVATWKRKRREEVPIGVATLQFLPDRKTAARRARRTRVWIRGDERSISFSQNVGNREDREANYWTVNWSFRVKVSGIWAERNARRSATRITASQSIN